MEEYFKLVVTSKTAGARNEGRSKVVYHVKFYGGDTAFCGTEPGKRSAWSEYPRIYDGKEEIRNHLSEVTCKRCRQSLMRYLGNTPGIFEKLTEYENANK